MSANYHIFGVFLNDLSDVSMVSF